MLTVVCFLWNDPTRQRSYTYTPEHVRILKSMVDRHLALPHRFVCVTDERLDGIETVPIDWRTHVPGTCGIKLTTWGPDAAERFGERILSLDLDVVLTNDIMPLVDRPEDVVLFRNPNYVEYGRRAFYQGSIQLLRAGSRKHVWANIFKSWAASVVNARFGGFEQAWLSEMLAWDEAYWDASDGIYGAGRLGDNGETVGSKLPENARLVVFPGNRMPGDRETQETHPWIMEHYR